MRFAKCGAQKWLEGSAKSIKIELQGLQNRPRTLPEPPRTPLKSINKSQACSKSAPDTIFSNFIDFWTARGLPKSSQNRKNPTRKRLKGEVKKTNVFPHIFLRIFSVLASENGAQIKVVLLFFRKYRFSEN